MESCAMWTVVLHRGVHLIWDAMDFLIFLNQIYYNCSKKETDMRKTKLFGCVLIMAVATTELMAAPQTQPRGQIICLSDFSEQDIHDFSQGDI
jgi:hypothetical protein